MKPPSGSEKKTKTNPVLSAACPELAEALSAAEGVVEWVEWANSSPILKISVLNFALCPFNIE